MRRLWRWMSRLLFIGLLAVTGIAVFHRQIILWTLNRFGPEGAKAAGLELKWKAGGSLWSDISISDVQASSETESMPLRQLKLGRLELRYDLSPAWAGDYFKIPKSVTLHDVQAIIDLRHPSPPSTTLGKPTDQQAIIDMVKKIVWPDIDLQNISITVLLPDATLKITDLDLNLPSGRQGTLHIAKVEHPALTQYPLRDVTAKLAINGAMISIVELELPPQIEVQQLKANAEEDGHGKVVASARVRSGAATIALGVKADLSGEHPLVDATIDIAGVDEKEIAPWIKDMPPVQAKLNTLHIVAQGDPLLPRKLNASVSLDVRDLGYEKYRCEGIALEAKLVDGKLNVSQLSASAGGNRIEVATQADVPGEWSGFAKTPLTLNWKLTAPALQNIAGLPMKVAGRINGDGAVKIAGQGLQGFEAHVVANDVIIDQSQLRSLDASVNGDLKSITVDAKAEAAAGDGKLEAQGKIGLETGTQSEATWHVTVPKPDELTKSLGIAWPADVGVGEISTEGVASFELAKLKASDFVHATGHGSLLVKNASWKSAPCERVSADWKLEGGKAMLSSLDVKLPGDNAIQLSANLTLANEQPFDAKVSVQAKDLAALRAWLDAAEAKQLQSGSVVLEWKGNGKLKDKPITSNRRTVDLGGISASSEASQTPRAPGRRIDPGRGRSNNLPASDTAATPAGVVAPSASNEASALVPRSDTSLLAGMPPASKQEAGVSGLTLAGNATLKIEALHHETLSDAASLETTFAHDLTSADFKQFTAKLGPWSASFTGKVSETLIDLTKLDVLHETKKLLTGEVRVPLDLQAKPVPVDPTKPLHVRIDTDGKLALSELAGIARQTLPPDLAGVVSASIHLDGTLPKLQSRIEVNAGELKLPKVPSKEPGKVNVLLTLDDGALKLDARADVKPVELLLVKVSAHVDGMAMLNDPKLAMETPFEANVKLNQPTLDFLKPMMPMLDDLRGLVLIDVKADGTAKAPHVHGTVKIDVPVVTPHDPDLPLVKDFKTEIVADDTTINLKSLHALAAGGEINVSGSCDLKDVTKPAFDVTLRARDLLAVRNEMMTLRTDADIRCQGVPTAASVTGSIGLTRGRVFQEVNFLPLNKMMNDLPPLPDAEASKPSAEPGASPLPPRLKDWTFDLGVKTKDEIRLLGNVMNGGVNMDLKVGGTGAAPQVLGDVKTDHAVLNLPFSTLRITEGIVHFGPENALLAPSLQLLAESTVDAYEIDLRGYGAVTDPKIHFSSTPPLPEGEIATLLATGSTTSGLKKASGDAAGRALLFVVREAYRRMFISKSKPKKAGEKEDESRFIVQERSEDGALGGVTGIYEFSRKMKIVGSTDKDGGFRAMLHYLFRFD
jgi:hypothetical protein